MVRNETDERDGVVDRLCGIRCAPRVKSEADKAPDSALFSGFQPAFIGFSPDLSSDEGKVTLDPAPRRSFARPQSEAATPPINRPNRPLSPHPKNQKGSLDAK